MMILVCLLLKLSSTFCCLTDIFRDCINPLFLVVLVYTLVYNNNMYVHITDINI